MPDQPKISVILPFFNAEQTLDRAISSIYQQDFKDFECILVDNNSTDNSRTIAMDWQSRDTRFKVFNEEIQGVMFASNKGFEQAVGVYVARMDADDRAYPERLRLQAIFLDDHPAVEAVAGLVKHVGDPDTTAGFRRFVEWSNSLQTYSEIYSRRFIESPIVNPTAMWKKETMERCGGYLAGDFPEDYEMWLRWLDMGVKIEKIPEVLLDWHDSEKRLTRTDSIYSDRSFYEIKSRYLAKWLIGKKSVSPFGFRMGRQQDIPQEGPDP